MKRQLFYFTLLGPILFFMACGDAYETNQAMLRKKHQETLRKDSMALKIATTPTMDCLPLFIAVEDSLFQKGGVDVRLRACTSQLDGDTLVEGEYVEGFVTDLIRAERLRKLGKELRYVTSTNAYWQLISNRMSRVKELKQMSDKMIAMTRYSVTDYLAGLAIDSVKPKFEVYRVQINDVAVRVKMLLNNQIDAILVTEPQATMARRLNNPILMDSRKKDMRFGVIAFREKALTDKTRQEQLASFVKIYNQVCDSINNNGVTHYAAIIRKYMYADDKTIAALPKLHYDHAKPPRLRDIERARKYWK